MPATLQIGCRSISLIFAARASSPADTGSERRPQSETEAYAAALGEHYSGVRNEHGWLELPALADGDIVWRSVRFPRAPAIQLQKHVAVRAVLHRIGRNPEVRSIEKKRLRRERPRVQ